VSQLPFGVSTPRPDAAVGFQRQTILIAGGDGDHLAQTRDTNGCESVDIGSIARLTGVVEPPCPYGAVGFQREAVRSAGRDSNHVADPGNADRHSSIGTIVADLPVGIISPRPDRTIGPGCHTVHSAPGHRDYAPQS